MLLETIEPRPSLNPADTAEVKSLWRQMVFAEDFSQNDKKHVMQHLAKGVKAKLERCNTGKKLHDAAYVNDPSNNKQPACLIEIWRKKAGRFDEVLPVPPEIEVTKWDDSVRCHLCVKHDHPCIRVTKVAMDGGDRFHMAKRRVKE